MLSLHSQNNNVAWLEVLSDQFIGSHGVLHHTLLQLRERYPMVMHSVGLSLGSADPLNTDYLKQLKLLADEISPAWVSDHAAFVSYDQRYFHDLLPLPHTQEVAFYVAERIRIVQDYLERPFLLENISSYARHAHDTLSEAEFLNCIAQEANCGLLLDINNVYVNSVNHAFDIKNYLQSLDKTRIRQIHLGGFSEVDNILVDTHSRAVHAKVWPWYQTLIAMLGPVPTNMEWDNDLPSWDILLQECAKAAVIFERECVL